MKRKAIIFGIKGIKLNQNEKDLLKIYRPWGIILFSRNIKDLMQTKSLIHDIKRIVKDKNYPIIIDQEGGSVSRLNKIFDLEQFSQSFFGKIYRNDKTSFKYYYKNYIDNVCNILNDLGININTVPVLDIRRKISEKVIGDRSFSYDPKIISEIGNLCIDLHKKNKIATVVKHIPGHGLTKQDSHNDLPIIKGKKNELVNKDFKVFKNKKSFFAMTAHVIYSAYDSLNTATHSKVIVNNVIRNKIGFKGILISDDISMKALKLGLIKNAIKALDAGCNLVLHCNGNFGEMRKLAKVIPTVDKSTEKKTSQFYKFLG